VFPVKYELGFYITEDDNLHSKRSENIRSYVRFWKISSVNGRESRNADNLTDMLEQNI
jgi:hypothetical protein